MLTSELIRAARMLLRWDQETLAERSGVPLTTLKKLELREGPLVTRGGTEEKLRSALEDGGVEFLNHGQPGVRMKVSGIGIAEAVFGEGLIIFGQETLPKMIGVSLEHNSPTDVVLLLEGRIIGRASQRNGRGYFDPTPPPPNDGVITRAGGPEIFKVWAQIAYDRAKG
jgi:transcriptional regulator with XRE-family HTH domain